MTTKKAEQAKIRKQSKLPHTRNSKPLLFHNIQFENGSTLKIHDKGQIFIPTRTRHSTSCNYSLQCNNSSRANSTGRKSTVQKRLKMGPINTFNNQMIDTTHMHENGSC